MKQDSDLLKAIIQRFLHTTEGQQLSEWWQSTASSYQMMSLLGYAYQYGELSRRRLVRVSLRCVETCAHLLPDEVLMDRGWQSVRSLLECLAQLSAWCAGADEVNLVNVQSTMRALCWTHRNQVLGNFPLVPRDAVPLTSALDAAIEVADAAGVGYGFGVDHAYAEAVAAHAKLAVSRAGDAFWSEAQGFGGGGALCDVIRDELDADELLEVLGESAS